MSASRPIGTRDQEHGDGAISGPPTCRARLHQVVLPPRPQPGFQPFSTAGCDGHDCQRLRASLIRKRSQVRVLDRPLTQTKLPQIWLFLLPGGSLWSGWTKRQGCTRGASGSRARCSQWLLGPRQRELSTSKPAIGDRQYRADSTPRSRWMHFGAGISARGQERS